MQVKESAAGQGNRALTSLRQRTEPRVLLPSCSGVKLSRICSPALSSSAAAISNELAVRRVNSVPGARDAQAGSQLRTQGDCNSSPGLRKLLGHIQALPS